MGIKFSQLPIASSVASDDYIAVLDTSESVLKRTPINHASQGSAYGLSTTTEYGHSKIIDNLTSSSLTSGESLSARQGNVIANDMGQVETSTTAAYAHTAGEYFILIGQFVKCIQNISVGGSITLGTNVEATSIGAVLGQLNSKIGSSDISIIGSTITGAINNIYNVQLLSCTAIDTCIINDVHLIKFGKVCLLTGRMSFGEDVAKLSSIYCFNLPASTYPTYAVFSAATTLSTSDPTNTNTGTVWVQKNTAGIRLALQQVLLAGTHVYFNMSWTTT